MRRERSPSSFRKAATSRPAWPSTNRRTRPMAPVSCSSAPGFKKGPKRSRSSRYATWRQVPSRSSRHQPATQRGGESPSTLVARRSDHCLWSLGVRGIRLPGWQHTPPCQRRRYQRADHRCARPARRGAGMVAGWRDDPVRIKSLPSGAEGGGIRAGRPASPGRHGCGWIERHAVRLWQGRSSLRPGRGAESRSSSR